MRTVPYIAFILLTALSIQAQEPPVITSPLSITVPTGAFFSYTITATGTLPISFSATPLPPGFSQFGETISGTPEAPGVTSISITATNSGGSITRTLVVTVLAPLAPPVITSPLAAGGTVGSPFAYTITAAGSLPINFTASPLPPGLSQTGSLISGEPTEAGTVNVNLTAMNAAGLDTETLVIVLNTTRVLIGPPVISSPLVASATVDELFRLQLTATGSQPVAFTAEGLPAGLSLKNSTIKGTPQTAGTFLVNLVASNHLGTVTETLNLTVTPPGVTNISGTWNGSAKGKSFDLSGANEKSSRVNELMRAVFTQSDNTLTATLTFSGKNGTSQFATNGQIANGNFSLSGATADGIRTITASGHLNKRGNSMSGNALIHSAQSFEELKFTLKK